MSSVAKALPSPFSFGDYVSDSLVIADRSVYADKSYDIGLAPVGDGTFAVKVYGGTDASRVASPTLVIAKGEMYGSPLATQIKLALHDNGDGTYSLGVAVWP